jgi:hypothetical protein
LDGEVVEEVRRDREKNEILPHPEITYNYFVIYILLYKL